MSRPFHESPKKIKPLLVFDGKERKNLKNLRLEKELDERFKVEPEKKTKKVFNAFYGFKC